MQSYFRSLTSALAATSALALVLNAALPARADDPDGADGPDPGVARLAVLRGEVDVKRADSGDTVAAAMNAPVSAGDYVTTHDGSRVEVQYGFGTAIRVGADTQVRFTRLDPDNHSLQIAQGTVAMRVFRGLEAHPDVETPAATVRPDEAGLYRVTVTNDGNTEVTVRSGRADVITSSGAQTLGPDSTLLIEGQGNDLRFQTIETVAYDGFDAWNALRDRAFERVRNYGYVDQGIVGADDLDQYGHWVDEPTYGQVWAPDENADWSPYHDGRWVWEPFYGWTWVGDEPWGYAPYHYGNWFYASNRWFWYPGAYAARREYRPALVGFFSFGFGVGGGIGLGFGFGNIGWVPLAPNEPFRPWWGRGYGGRTTIVNNITNIRNVTNITNNYRNLRAPGAAVAVSNNNFASGNFSHPVRVSAGELKSVTPVRGVVPVVPTEHNLAYSAHAAPAAASAPLNSRFANFKTAKIANPPSFTAQRSTVAATAQRIYPEHAAAIARPQTIPPAATNGLVSSSPERTNAAENGAAERNSTQGERNTTQTERSTTPAERNGSPAENATSHDPWSRFGQGGSSREAPPTGTQTGRTSESTRGASAPAQTTPRQPASSNAASSGAWGRFGNNGAAATETSHANSTGTSGTTSTTGRRYDGYGSPATSNVRSSTPAYHEPATPTYHQAPASSYHEPATSTYHEPAASTYHAPPANHAPARPANSGGGQSHAAPPAKSAPSKPAAHDGDRGH